MLPSDLRTPTSRTTGQGLGGGHVDEIDAGRDEQKQPDEAQCPDVFFVDAAPVIRVKMQAEHGFYFVLEQILAVRGAGAYCEIP